MLAELRRRPWTLRRQAARLAELHERLHEIPAPPGLPAAGTGDRLLHLDLHPENVILSPNGPVVIDFDRGHLLGALPAAAERRVADPNVTDRERRAVERFVQRAGVG